MAFAQGFDQDVSYGQSGSNVLEVQEFLGTQNLFAGPYTGNFYSLTLAAVKKFQAINFIPTTGYFGPLSRAAAQAIVAGETADNETATTTAPVAHVQAPATTPITIWPQYYTLPTGVIISIAQDGTVMILTTPAQIAASGVSTNTTPTNSQTMDTQTTQQAAASQPAASAAPFVLSGSVDVTLAQQVTSLSLGGNMRLFSLTLNNKSNDTLVFRSALILPKDMEVTGISNFIPQFNMLLNNQDIAKSDGIAPGKSGTIFFTLTNAQAGSFTLSLNALHIVGAESGANIEITGLPITLSPVVVQ